MMPNPEDPTEAECPKCHDSGMVPGTYSLCVCTGSDGPRWMPV